MPRLSGNHLSLEKQWSLYSDLTHTFNKNTPSYLTTLRAAFKQHDSPFSEDISYTNISVVAFKRHHTLDLKKNHMPRLSSISL